jgi:hypothetical protein
VTVSVIYEPLDDSSVLTVAEFSKMFRLSESAVRRGVASGMIPGQKIGGVYRCFVACSRSFTEEDAEGLAE